MMTVETPPMPLEWHPAYRDQIGLLLDWLNGTGHYADRDRLLVPYSRRPLTASVTAELFPTGASHEAHMLTKRRCWGLAPYVGRPFAYAWWAATDELGRSVAGESTVQYRDPMDELRDWGPDPRSVPLI